ncbi:MAG: MFS transporter [bacterium]|nr:MFS transporter [bacterium]
MPNYQLVKNILKLRDFILGYLVMIYFSFFSTLYLYLPLIVKDLSVEKTYIGILGTFYSLGSVLSGFFISPIIDKYKKYTITFIRIALILQAILIFSLLLFDNIYYYIIVLLSIGLTGAFYIGTCFSLSNNRGITVSISSLGFLIGYFIGSIVNNYKFMFISIFFLYILGFILLFLFILKKNESNYTQAIDNNNDSIKIFFKNINIYLPLVFRHSGAAMIWLFFTYILLNYYHLDLKAIGILNAINIVVQTFSNPILAIFVYKINKKLISFILVIFGYFLSALYFILFYFVKDFHLLCILQVLLGLSFSSLYLGNIENLILNNKEKITALSLLSSVMSLSNLIGSFLGTILFNLGYKFMFFVAFILSFLALVFYILGNYKNIFNIMKAQEI